VQKNVGSISDHVSDVVHNYIFTWLGELLQQISVQLNTLSDAGVRKENVHGRIEALVQRALHIIARFHDSDDAWISDEDAETVKEAYGEMQDVVRYVLLTR
jgi:hypothetical protein